MAAQNCPTLSQGSWDFIPPCKSVMGCGLLWRSQEAIPVSQGQNSLEKAKGHIVGSQCSHQGSVGCTNLVKGIWAEDQQYPL